MDEKPGLLIVDDDAEVLKSLQLWLKNEGFRVFTAGDKLQALELIQKKEIAVCLVDLHLKNEDGLRLAAEMKALDEFLKIIVITGYPSYESAIDAMKTGIFDYISKSTENDAILRKLHAALEERQGEMAGKGTATRPASTSSCSATTSWSGKGWKISSRRTPSFACSTSTIPSNTSKRTISTWRRPWC